MKYLCLVYGDEHVLHAHPDSPRDPECHAYDVEIDESGRRLAAEALAPVSAATTVRVRGGETQLVDGPFAETKETLGGFYIVEAADLDEAIEWAAKIPNAPKGSVEIRPIMDFDA